MRALERDPAKRYERGRDGRRAGGVVLRKSYSTRELARKARELADQESPVMKARPTPIATEAPPTVGSDEFDGDRRRVAAVRGAGHRGAGPPDRSPRAARPLAVGRGRRSVPLRRGPAGRRAAARRAVGASAVQTVARPRLPSPAAGRAAAGGRASAPTVRVAVDSAPQGATVSSAAGTLGKTP